MHALEQSAAEARAQAAICGTRRDALQDAAGKLAVGASVAVRLATVLVAEAVQAATVMFGVMTRLAAVSWASGLINNGTALPCNATFADDQCVLIGNLQALQSLRDMDKAAHRPERLLPLNESQLHALLVEEVSPAEEATISTLASAGSDNPFAGGDPGVLALFHDIKAVSDAVHRTEAMIAATNGTADASLAAIELMRRQVDCFVCSVVFCLCLSFFLHSRQLTLQSFARSHTLIRHAHANTPSSSNSRSTP